MAIGISAFVRVPAGTAEKPTDDRAEACRDLGDKIIKTPTLEFQELDRYEEAVHLHPRHLRASQRGRVGHALGRRLILTLWVCCPSRAHFFLKPALSVRTYVCAPGATAKHLTTETEGQYVSLGPRKDDMKHALGVCTLTSKMQDPFRLALSCKYRGVPSWIHLRIHYITHLRMFEPIQEAEMRH